MFPISLFDSVDEVDWPISLLSTSRMHPDNSTKVGRLQHAETMQAPTKAQRANASLPWQQFQRRGDLGEEQDQRGDGECRTDSGERLTGPRQTPELDQKP